MKLIRTHHDLVQALDDQAHRLTLELAQERSNVRALKAAIEELQDALRRAYLEAER